MAKEASAIPRDIYREIGNNRALFPQNTNHKNENTMLYML